MSAFDGSTGSGSGTSAREASAAQAPLFAMPSVPSASQASIASNHASALPSLTSPLISAASPPSMTGATGSSATSTQRQTNPVQRAISPPTPAPSPQPDARTLHHLNVGRDTSTDDEYELISDSHGIMTPTHDKEADDVSGQSVLSQLLLQFPRMNSKDRYALLSQFVDLCNARELAHLSSLISPRLKVDFLSALPIEVSLQIISHLDDPRTLARASGVSRFWRSLVNDEQTWKIMCKRYHFRQVPASRSLHMLGVETPDQTMEMGGSTDAELASSLGGDHGSLNSSQVLGSLYDAYRARGLDPSMALSELKAIHELFLSKRSREMGIEERRRQVHALQHDNVFMDMMRDQAFATRMADANMSEEDRRFYRQLEEFVREKQAEGGSSVDGHDGESASGAKAAIRSPDAQDTATVGWLSTGPPSTRTLGGPSSSTIANEDDHVPAPQTPLAASSSSRYFGPASSLPFREVGRSLVSPTSRLGSMTSGILTSLWDRAGSAAVASGVNSGASLDVQDAPSHPPSAGDHGHSTEGHNDADDEELDEERESVHNVEEDQEMANADDEQEATLRKDSTTQASASHASSSVHLHSVAQHRRNGSRKTSRRFAPFHRHGDESASTDQIPQSASSTLGLGRPSAQSSRSYPLRSATNVDDLVSANEDGGQAIGSSLQGSDYALRRAASANTQMSASLRSLQNKPFSYKTHFKLAYQTESNWLRGGRLLTQHVSSDDASGEGATVTSLSIDDEWIVVGMANAKIHAFDARTGLFVRTLNGHTAGVWCLALISASGNKSSTTKGKSNYHRGSAAHGRGKERAGASTMAQDQGTYTVGAYPYDNDRPLYTPTPDLNLIHHDPRPAASVFSPEMRYAEISIEEADESFIRPPMPMPSQFASWSHSQGEPQLHRSIHDTLQANRNVATPSQPDPFFSTSAAPPKAAVDAAAAARAAANPRSQFASRGAGLGSNFGSPCGSVAGYGNEHAMVVSSGCDRDIRVWDLVTGECKYVLSGHRSTVRCLRVFDGRPIAISGSRDGTMRVWNVETGQLQHLLPGHQHSVRCIDLAGNLVASASYDCTARIWNVDTGKCLHVLRGHYHQLYAIAFDGVHVATGSLDTTVRIWSAETGECLATLQGHQSLVGQLQLTDSTLITGGSDGKVIVFSLKTMKMVYQLLAHDNSVTCLQFDDRFIVTGGNDGKVKLWNFRTGEFVRELCESSGQVWKVSFRDDKCVVLCRRNDKTAMDVISFRPIEESV